MFVKSVNWIDEIEKEAEILVSDGNTDVICFSHPFTKDINDKLEEPLYCFDVENVVSSDSTVTYINKTSSNFGYFICGKYEGGVDKRVIVGDIIVSLDDAYIPCDITEGSFVEFNASRIDLY